MILNFIKCNKKFNLYILMILKPKELLNNYKLFLNEIYIENSTWNFKSISINS